MLQTKKIKCLVVDDEPPAREVLKQYISEVEALELAGTCSNAVEAISFLKDHQVDLLFLDILQQFYLCEQSLYLPVSFHIVEKRKQVFLQTNWLLLKLQF